MKCYLSLLLLICCLCTAYAQSQKRLKNLIYSSISSYNACYRRLNGTNQVGCGTSDKGQYGVLQYVESNADLNWIVRDGPHAPYVALLPLISFTEPVLLTLKEYSSRVAGVLVIHNLTTVIGGWLGSPQTPKSLSFDTKCPAVGYSLYSQPSEFANCAAGNWNPPGDSLLFEDLPFPLFLLTSTSEIAKLIGAYKRSNQPIASNGSSIRVAPSYPLASVELTSTMFAFQSTETCMRRNDLGQRAALSPQSFCEPVAPRSAIGTLKPIRNSTTATQPARGNQSVILVVTTVDAETPFLAALTGARQIASLATLLGVAEALGKVKQLTALNDSVLDVAFITLYGESLDRGASQRLAYDLVGGARAQNVPSQAAAIRWENVHSVIEIGQVTEPEVNGNDYAYYAHSDPISRRASARANATVDRIVSLLDATSGNLNLTVREPVKDGSRPLPPSSIHSLLRVPSLSQLPAVLVSDHVKSFRNQFYQSTLDTVASVDYLPVNGSVYSPLVRRVTLLATTVARTVLALALGTTADDELVRGLQANAGEVDKVLGCLLTNASCELLRNALDYRVEVPAQPSVYLFSNAISFARAAQSVPRHLLGWYLGEHYTNTTNVDQCKALVNGRPPFSAVFTRGNFCVVSLAQDIDSTSPAFLISNYNFSSYEYAAWTESIWGNAFGVRVFMQSSLTYQILVLFLGIVLTLLGGGFSWWVVKYASPILILSTQSQTEFSASPSESMNSPLDARRQVNVHQRIGDVTFSTPSGSSTRAHVVT